MSFRIVKPCLSRQRARSDAGYTLVEMLTVMGLVALLATSAMLSLRAVSAGILRRDAQAQILSAYEQARSRAVTGVGGESHGVHIESDEIVLFSGASYVPGDGEVFPVPGGLSVTATNDTVIFTRLSGQPDTATTVSVESAFGSPALVDVGVNGSITASE